MPCFDAYKDYDSEKEDNKRNLIRSERENDINKTLKDTYKNRCNFLEAQLCALMSELIKTENGAEIIARASRNGLVDLMTTFNEHKKDDVSRLALEIHKYSIHEQEIIKQLLT